MKTHIIPALIISATIMVAGLLVIGAQAKTNDLLTRMYAAQIRSYTCTVQQDILSSPKNR